MIHTTYEDKEHCSKKCEPHKGLGIFNKNVTFYVEFKSSSFSVCWKEKTLK